MKDRFRLLFSAVADESAAAQAGGGAASSDASEQAPAAPAAAEPEPVKPPNIIQLAAAAVQSKSAILARAADAEKQLAEASTRITDLQTAAETLREELAAEKVRVQELEAERAEILKTLSTAEAAAASVEAAAVSHVAALGFPADQAPTQQSAADTPEELEARLSAETDPKKRYELAAKINAAHGSIH
jgi:chromosome segregation ATPase